MIALDLGQPPLAASFTTSDGRRRFGAVPYPPPLFYLVPRPTVGAARFVPLDISISAELQAFDREALELERIRPPSEGGPCADYVPRDALALRRMGAAVDAAYLSIGGRK